MDVHLAEAEAHDIGWIDVVVCNLYPFEQTIQRDGVAASEVVEQIDIGGPSMVRSAAKNHGDVVILARRSPGLHRPSRGSRAAR